MAEGKVKTPWGVSIFSTWRGNLVSVSLLLLTGLFAYLSPQVGQPEKAIFFILSMVVAVASWFATEQRKKVDSWQTTKKLLTAEQKIREKESQLEHVYNRPIWKLKETLKKYQVTGTLDDYLFEMARTCQSVVSYGHKPPWKLRTSIYQLNYAPLETDDGNEIDESSKEEPVLTLVHWEGRSDRPRASYLKNTTQGLYTLSQLLDKTGKDRELFHPNFTDYPLPGLSAEEVENKSYNGFYALPIMGEDSKKVLGMLTFDCDEKDCFSEEDRALMRHLAAMVSLGFMGSQSNPQRTVHVLKPPGFDEKIKAAQKHQNTAITEQTSESDFLATESSE